MVVTGHSSFFFVHSVVVFFSTWIQHHQLRQDLLSFKTCHGFLFVYTDQPGSSEESMEQEELNTDAQQLLKVYTELKQFVG